MGQYIPIPSPVHLLDARSKLVAALLLTAAVLRASFPVGILVLIFVVGICLTLTRIHPGWFFRPIRPLIWLILATAAIQMLFTPGQVLVQASFLSITGEGLRSGAALLLKLILVVSLAQLFAATTTPLAMTGALEQLLKPLRRIKFPVHDLVMIMSLSLRFIPLLAEETDRIFKAQLCRGFTLVRGNFRQNLGRMLAILLPVFRAALQRSTELAEAMEARGYRAGAQRSHLYTRKMTGWDYGSIGMALVVTLAIGLI